MSESSTSRGQVAVALITTVGVIATGLFANWDKIFPAPAAETTSQSEESSSPAVAGGAGEEDRPEPAEGGGARPAADRDAARLGTPGAPTVEELLARATVLGVRTFASSAATTPWGERRYAESFESESTMYIAWELGLEHPEPPPVRVPMVLDFRFVDAGGDVVAQSTFDTYVDAGWDSSYHASKWGRAVPGWWDPGVYRVEVRYGDRLLAERALTVYATAAPPSSAEDLPSALGSFDLEFFETPRSGFVPKDQREYRTVFRRDATRSIAAEVSLVFSTRPARRIDFDIEVIYRTPSGALVGRAQCRAHVEGGWSSSWHACGYGWEEAGRWEVGTYRVEVRLAGKLLAEGTFVVN